MGKVNWDNIGALWDFNYQANIMTKPYSGGVLITNPNTEPVITGTLNPMILTCNEDIQTFKTWFSTGEMLVTCPLFYRDGDVLDKSGNIIVKCKASVERQQVQFATLNDFNNFPIYNFNGVSYQNYFYSYSNVWFVGNNSLGGRLISNSTQARWKLKIAPKERGFKYHQANINSPMRVDAIEFVVLPRPPVDINTGVR